ncbi:hypothetical protein [Paenibacillus caui]|uniref:hypothetical protein n=1 Tax=Paenibacillus caui TaxID=2873927 RepID=UPI001CA8E69D|nr:hypothetical protein [Paenibacillus caui]
MKITEWAIVFVLIAGPFFWASSLRADNRMETLILEQRYNAALRTSAMDGASMLNVNELPSYEAGYASSKFFRVDKQAGLEAMLHTLYVNFHVEDDPAGQLALLDYIPAVVVIDYDGYSIYGVQDLTGPNGEAESKHAWFPKKPYAYQDASGNVLSFTLDNRLTMFDRTAGLFLHGRSEEIAAFSSDELLGDTELLDSLRRTTIVTSIERDLEAVISKHNQYTSRIGITYTFTLPLISGEDWNNTLDDAGMIVFLQGIPIGDRYYNNFAMGGGRLLKRYPVLGGVDEATGIKYYYRAPCGSLYRTEETFASERDAAAKGYFEAKCTNEGG